MTNFRVVLLAMLCAVLVGCGDAAKKAEDKAKGAAKAAGDKAGEAMEKLEVEGVNLGEKFTAFTHSLEDTLGDVKDGETAKEALHELEEAETNLGEMLGLAGKLPASAFPAFKGMVEKAQGSLEPMVRKLLANEQIAAVLKPVLDKILGTMSTFTEKK